MEKQKTITKKIGIKFFAVLSCLLLFLVFSGQVQETYANAEMFVINAVDYEVGTWATENIVVTATAKQGFESGQIFYSINDPINFLPYQTEVVVETEGENFVYFKFEYTGQGGYTTEEYDSIEIKLDKTSPIVDKIVFSEEDFTTQPVSMKIYLADSSMYKEEYRAIIFDETYLPLPEFFENGQIVFEFVTERNTVLNVGDIVLIDQANNQTTYNQKVVINNIDNAIPDFHLNLLNGKNQWEKQIEIELGYIHSEVKEIILIYPSGNEISLPIQETQKIIIKENGEYIIRVVSHTDAVFARGIIVNEIEPMPLTLVLFVVFVVGLSGIGIAIATIIFNKNKIIKTIKKKD